MSERKLPDITDVTIEISLDATVDIKIGEDHNWLKPGTKASFSFGGIPSGEQIKICTDHFMHHVIEPQLDDVISAAFNRIESATAQNITVTKV